ncbi:MAG: energy transducer TonB [Terriglobales bacterium]
MPKLSGAALVFFLLCCFICGARSQTSPTLAGQPGNLNTIVVSPGTSSDSVIVVPPARLQRVGFHNEKHVAGDLTAWLNKETALNGLYSPELQPWHIVVIYDQFDEDGDNVHSGVYEEFWAGPKKYKRIYKSDNFNQTDYATARGLFRRGDQQWPDRAEEQVRTEVLAPFSFAATLQGSSVTIEDRVFGPNHLQCALIEQDSPTVSDPTQYCFEPDSSVLRYVRGLGWDQTAYNGIATFQGRNIAREIEVTDGGKPYLKLRVQTLEMISHVDEADLAPPPDALDLQGKRVSGVHPKPVKSSYPEYPASLRGQHFSVDVEFVIGKDGHVLSAHAISGPKEGRKACEDAIRKWVYSPYLVLGEPVEVEAKSFCSHQ